MQTIDAVVADKNEYTRKADNQPGCVLILVAMDPDGENIGTMKCFLTPLQLRDLAKDKSLFRPGSCVKASVERKQQGFSSYLTCDSCEPSRAKASLIFDTENS